MDAQKAICCNPARATTPVQEAVQDKDQRTQEKTRRLLLLTWCSTCLDWMNLPLDTDVVIDKRVKLVPLIHVLPDSD